MRKAAVLVPVVAIGFLLPSACAREQAGSARGGAQSITITSPAEAADVAAPIELVVSVDGAEIGPPDTGNMHLHVYVGDTGDYEVITSTTSTVPAPAGQQAIEVVLAEANHEETDVSASVTVNVTEGGTQDGTGGYQREYGDG